MCNGAPNQMQNIKSSPELDPDTTNIEYRLLWRPSPVLLQGFKFEDLFNFIKSNRLNSWKDLQYLPLQSPRFPPPHHQYASPGSYLRIQSPPSSILPSPNAQLSQGPRKKSLCGCYDIIRLHKKSSQPCSFKKKNLLSCLL